MDSSISLVDITVAVNLEKTSSGNGVSISVDPDPLVLSLGQQYRINWSLTTGTGMSGWDFDETAGVDIRNKKGKFNSPQGPGAGPKKFSWKNDANAAGDYKYVITLTDGTNTYTIDPTIRNQ
jgi:hypothetical protein